MTGTRFSAGDVEYVVLAAEGGRFMCQPVDFSGPVESWTAADLASAGVTVHEAEPVHESEGWRRFGARHLAKIATNLRRTPVDDLTPEDVFAGASEDGDSTPARRIAERIAADELAFADWQVGHTSYHPQVEVYLREVERERGLR